MEELPFQQTGHIIISSLIGAIIRGGTSACPAPPVPQRCMPVRVTRWLLRELRVALLL